MMQTESTSSHERSHSQTNSSQPPTPNLSMATPASTQANNLSSLNPRETYHVRQQVFSLAQEYTLSRGETQPVCYATRSRYYLRSLGIAAIVLSAIILSLIVFLRQSTDNMSGFLILGECAVILTAAIAMAVYITPRRHILFYSDEARTNKIWSVNQDTKIQLIHNHYSVKTAAGTLIGKFHKNQFTDFLRKKWTCYDEHGNVLFLAYEDSIIIALLRRVLKNFFGLLRMHFVFTAPGGGSIFADFNRDFSLRDRYTLKFIPTDQSLPDGRLLLAMAVILDTGERR